MATSGVDRHSSLRSLVDPRNFDGLMPETTVKGALRATTPLQPARTAEEETAGVRLPGDPVSFESFDTLALRPMEAVRILETSDDPVEKRRAWSAINAYEAVTDDRVLSARRRLQLALRG